MFVRLQRMQLEWPLIDVFRSLARMSLLVVPFPSGRHHIARMVGFRPEREGKRTICVSDVVRQAKALILCVGCSTQSARPRQSSSGMILDTCVEVLDVRWQPPAGPWPRRAQSAADSLRFAGDRMGVELSKVLPINGLRRVKKGNS